MHERTKIIGLLMNAHLLRLLHKMSKESLPRIKNQTRLAAWAEKKAVVKVGTPFAFIGESPFLEKNPPSWAAHRSDKSPPSVGGFDYLGSTISELSFVAAAFCTPSAF